MAAARVPRRRGHAAAVQSGDVTIDKFEAEAPVGMHHILAYHVPKNAADVTGDVFDCGDVPGAIWYEQSADAIGSSFPEGVGIKLQGGEVVRVELHDPTSRPPTPHATFESMRGFRRSH